MVRCCARLEESAFVSSLFSLLDSIAGSLGNVYNEKVMKQDMDMSIHLQNAQLYAFGIVYNAISLFLHGNMQQVTSRGMFAGFTWTVWLLVCVNATMGLTISLVLKHLDNMFYVFVHELAVVAVLVLSYFLFDFRPDLSFLTAAVTVGMAIFIYNTAKPPAQSLSREEPAPAGSPSDQH